MRESGPITICVINMKGGVGKSTITALLSRYAFMHGLDVLAIDLDPQANLSQGLMQLGYKRFLDQRLPSVVEIFNGYVPPSTTSDSASSLGNQEIAIDINRSGDRSLQLIPSRFDFADNLVAAVRPNPRTLAAYLNNKFKFKDVIFIDCAPTESILTHAAYHASRKVLVPVKPEFFATVGFPLMQTSLTTFRNANPAQSIDVIGVVINNAFYDGGNNGGPEKAKSLREIKVEAKKNGWHIFKDEIPFSRGFPKRMRGDSSYSGNSYMFDSFAYDFFKRLELLPKP